MMYSSLSTSFEQAFDVSYENQSLCIKELYAF